VNKFVKFWIFNEEETIFYAFFFLFTFFLIYSLYTRIKKALHNKFAFNIYLAYNKKKT